MEASGAVWPGAGCTGFAFRRNATVGLFLEVTHYTDIYTQAILIFGSGKARTDRMGKPYRPVLTYGNKIFLSYGSVSGTEKLVFRK